MLALPKYVTREVILQRLPLIFPVGTPNRKYCIRELSASTIFTMLYIGAVEGNKVYLSPVYVYRMTEEYSTLSDEESRHKYRLGFLKKGFQPEGKRWYADNTREPIRDETLREGLSQVGAVMLLKTMDTTSSKARYYLQESFAALFDPDLTGDALNQAIEAWKSNNLSTSALTRIRLANQNANESSEKILVSLPNRETRLISPGKSSTISKAVIEDFAIRFLESPVVLWLSTSADKTVAADVALASSIGLNIEADKNLPDIILVDLGPSDPLVVFIEVVATDGPITDRRQLALLELTDAANFERNQVVFVTAYLDRAGSEFKKTIDGLAWNSFAWFVSEPDKLVFLIDGTEKISRLISTIR